MEQLLLFQESKEERLEREVQRLKEQCENVRKGQFAKIGKLNKLYEDLSRELEIIKIGICKGK